MIPILFDSEETDFTANGKGRLVDAISCLATEARNGPYELELTYPMEGRLFDDLMDGGVIGAIHDDNGDIQPFDLYRSEAGIDGRVKFSARHISYRLSNIIVSPFSVTGISNAMTALKNNSVNTNPFTFSTDKTTASTFANKRPRSARSLLLGAEGSFLDIAGSGDYKFDKWTVSFLENRGRDTGVTVRYGKNLSDLNQEIDKDSLFSAVAPFYQSENDVVYLPEYFVGPTTAVSPVVIREMDFTDQFEQVPTQEQLRNKAVAFLDQTTPWIPKQNLTVDFVALWQTEEYKDLAEIQKVGLCDLVSIYYPKLGVVAEKQKVVSVTYDVLAERFTKIELGDTPKEYVAIDDGTSSASSSTPRYTSHTLTPVSGVTFDSDYTFCKQYGGVISIGFVTNSFALTGDWKKIGEVPAGIYPPAIATGQGIRGSVLFSVEINTSGEIRVRGASSATGALRGTITYII